MICSRVSLLGWASNPSTLVKTTKIPVGTETTLTTTADSFTATLFWHGNCYPASPSHPHSHVVFARGPHSLKALWLYPLLKSTFPDSLILALSYIQRPDRISVRFQPDGLWTRFSCHCSWLQPRRRSLQPNKINSWPSGSWASCLTWGCDVITLCVPYHRCSTQSFWFAPEICCWLQDRAGQTSLQRQMKALRIWTYEQYQKQAAFHFLHFTLIKEKKKSMLHWALCWRGKLPVKLINLNANR